LFLTSPELPDLAMGSFGAISPFFGWKAASLSAIDPVVVILGR